MNELSTDTFDEALANYGNRLYEDDPRAAARISIQRIICYSLMVIPEMYGKFHRTKRIIKAWNIHTPTTSATPVSRDIMLAFTGKFLEERNTDCALYMAICWGGLLRISEAEKLRRKNLSLPTDLRAHSQRPADIGIAIDNAKTGPHQYAFVADDTLTRIIHRITDGLSADDHILSTTPKVFNKELKRLSKHFGFESYPISSHSNRIGGALHLFLQDLPAEDIAIRGRWAVQKSLKHYLNNGRKWLAQIEVMEDIRSKLDTYMKVATTFADGSTLSHTSTPS